jgi:hypothetical protein
VTGIIAKDALEAVSQFSLATPIEKWWEYINPNPLRLGASDEFKNKIQSFNLKSVAA